MIFQCGLGLALPSLLPWELPGSAMELLGEVRASSCLPRPAPKIWQEATSVCASAAAADGLAHHCELGGTPEVDEASPSGGKAPKGDSS